MNNGAKMGSGKEKTCEKSATVPYWMISAEVEGTAFRREDYELRKIV